MAPAERRALAVAFRIGAFREEVLENGFLARSPICDDKVGYEPLTLYEYAAHTSIRYEALAELKTDLECCEPEDITRIDRGVRAYDP